VPRRICAHADSAGCDRGNHYRADRSRSGDVCEAGAARGRLFKGGRMMKKGTVFALIALVILIALVPLFLLKDAEFGGSDDAGSAVVEEVDSGYEVWAAPVLERILGGELPGEVESLFFCIQTGIGVGIVAFFMGRFVERKKQGRGE